MYKYLIISISIISLITLTGCMSEEQKPEPEPVVETVTVVEPVEEKIEVIIPEPVKVIEEKKVVEKPEEKQVAQVEPIKAPTPVESEEDAEYARSVNGDLAGSISKDEFQEDKKNIMEVIDDLAKIMKTKDYDAWLKYVSPSSKKYWSDPKNLATVASRLPVKGLKITSMKDYFLYVFIPARQNSKVEEIRYISTTVTKAVEPRESEDIIFYLFEKSASGDWLLKLDTL